MKPFRKAGAKTWQVRLYGADGKPVDRSTETRDKGSANAVARTVEKVREQLKYRELYTAMAEKRLSPLEVWEADTRDTLAELLASLSDVNVEPLVDEWRRRLTMGEGDEERRKKVAPTTAKGYLSSVRLLIPEGEPFPSSRLTTDYIQEWLDGMEEDEPNTVRNRAIGAHRFISWLVRPKRILATDPFHAVEAPSPGKPRDHHIETDEAIALAEAQPGSYRNFSALLPGSGIEVSTALTITVRDVFRDTREIRARGTKTQTPRDRVVRVTDWAWPYVEAQLRRRLPGARLFDDIPDRFRALTAHNAAVEKLVGTYPILRGYTMRDARHTWAVRAVRSGWPIEAVARQLGHVNGILALKVYGRFIPQSQERDRWEGMSTKRDAERKAARKTER